MLKAGPAAWWQCLAVIAKASDTSLSQKVRLLALVFVAGKLAGLARTKGWSHIHVHSCANAASIAMFASLLSKVSYSLTLHGPLTDYSPNQEQKWHFSAFAILITKKLYDEVNKCLAGHLPQKVEIAPMGLPSRVSKEKHHTPHGMEVMLGTFLVADVSTDVKVMRI